MTRNRSILGATIAMMMLPAMAQADVTVYGKIHVSGDAVDIGAGAGHGLSSNSTRIGFKGKNDLNYGLKAIWKIETELDVSDDMTKFKGRNRYIGLNYGKSTLIGGYHDTPFKTLGGKVDVLSDTVADRRAILGRTYQDDKKFDARANDAVMYINKSVKGVEFRLMRSAGSTNAEAGDKTPITSTSVLYKTSQYMLGASYEAKEADRTSGMRLLGGVAFGATRVTAIYEQLDFGDSDAVPGWDRTVMGLSATHKMGPTSIKAQAYFANDIDSVSDSGSRMYAAGVFHKLAKPFEVYGVVARLENDDNAKYTLTGSGHGDSYRPSGAGANMHSVSFGAVYKF